LRFWYAVNLSDVGTSGGEIKALTGRDLRRILDSTSLVSTVSFWRELERMASPKQREFAMGLLRALSWLNFESCQGWALSPEHAECLKYCGLTPKGLVPLGSVGTSVSLG
jgi:hypothetical protein